MCAASLQRPKGTQDLLGESMTRWAQLEAAVREPLQRAGYQEIRTPVFEHAELYLRGVGDSTDIVNKEMYQFDRGERSFCLRPEGTAGVVRAYIEQGLHRSPKPVKLFYLGPMFRYERPQEGRQRQFHQLGCEVLGLDTAACDADAIAMATRILQAVGIEDVTLHLNNVGNSEDRPAFQTAFKAVVAPHLSELCEDCHRRYEQNPLRMLDCKVPTCVSFYQGEAVSQFLSGYQWPESTQVAFDETVRLLRALGLKVEINPRLVRGLDYYTRTVFEITSNHLGAQNTLCGGGRYNRLVETLGGPETPAVGWAFGLERLGALATLPRTEEPLYYLVHDHWPAAYQLGESLRQGGLTVEVDVSGKAFGKQLQAASKRGAAFALILGETERQSNQLLVKRLADGEQISFTVDDALINQLLSFNPSPVNTKAD